MTHEPWEPPTEPWAPDETETQWVRSTPAPPYDAPAPTVPTAASASTEPVTVPPLAAASATAAAFPEPGTTNVAAASASRAGSDFTRLGLVARAACPLLMLAGLTWDDDGSNGWHTSAAWALFALGCAVVQLAPLIGRRVGLRMSDETGWFLAMVGTVGLAAYWLVIVLPGDASSNAGFFQTLAVWLAVVAAWLTPGRHRPIR